VRVYETGSCTILMLTPHPGLLPFKGGRNLMGQHWDLMFSLRSLR
jgi:hypothetical protein